MHECLHDQETQYKPTSSTSKRQWWWTEEHELNSDANYVSYQTVSLHRNYYYNVFLNNIHSLSPGKL